MRIPTSRLSLLVVLPLASASLADAQSVYGPPVPHAAGNHPLEVASADLNGDTNPDVAVANRGGADGLYLYFGDGAGGLSAPVVYTAMCGDPRDVELADVDEDGDEDALVLCAATGSLSVMLNDGTGVLGLPSLFPLSAGVQRMATGDIDLDGYVDVCVSRFYQGDVQVLLNDRTGAFTVTHTLPLPLNGSDVLLRDLDQDGWLDLVAIVNDYGAGDTLSVFLGDGQGGFGPRVDHPVGSADLSNLACADFDRDGNLDLAVGCGAGAAVLSGDGAGGLGAPTVLTSPAWIGGCVDLEAVHVDGDAFSDLVAITHDPQQSAGALATVFSYDPPAGWESDGDYALGHDASWGGVAAPDLDGDGFPELVTAGYWADGISVLHHAGTDCDGDGYYDPEAIEDGLAPDANANGVPDGCECLVETYCEGLPNTVGPGGRIGANGIPSLSLNAFTLTASGLPPSQSGLFFFGPDELIPPIPFGEGLRCVQAPIFRIEPPLTIDSTGRVAQPLDFTQLPASIVQAGETWCFQLWYRDPCPGCAGWNLTDALRVTFCE